MSYPLKIRYSFRTNVIRKLTVLSLVFVSPLVKAAETLLDEQPLYQIVYGLRFHSGKPFYQVFDSNEKWSTFWASPDATTKVYGSTPAFDFEKSTLVIAASGMKPNAGYSLDIDSVQKIKDEFVVSLRDTSADSKCPKLQEISYPQIAFLLLQPKARVKFVIVAATRKCANVSAPLQTQ